jgi:LysW-gamma-L-lysine carboxypeptidase
MSGAGTEPVGLLLKTLRTYSPSTHEAKLAALLKDEMKKLGYKRIRIDSAGNVIGEIGSGRLRLLLCGHMDTVPGMLPVSSTKDAIRGRGAADAKSPLCALLLAGARSADAGVSITFAGAADEEGDGAGINKIIKTGPDFDYAVFGEPSGASRVTVGYRGRVSVHVKVETTGGHAGSSWAHRSAFDEFNSVLSKLRAYEQSKTVTDDHFNSFSISPTLVTAGTYHNVIPSTCEATLDVRIPPTMNSEQVIKELRNVALGHADDARIELRFDEPTEAYLADPTSVLVRAFQRAILLQLKTKPSLVRKTGTGDMNTFAQRKHAECVTYGAGMSKTSHTDDEMVEVKDYLGSIDVLTEAIRQLGNLGKVHHS